MLPAVLRTLARDVEHSPSTTYRPDIDGLRALAVLAVVAYHAFPERVHGGFVGVDMFFVISGFLITRIILAEAERGAFSYRAFYARRIRRLFPALAVVLAAVLVLGYLLLLPDEFGSLGLHVGAGAWFASNLLLWRESGYFAAAAEHKPLLHLWSLGVEEQFYLLWPLTLMALRGFHTRVYVWTAAIAIVSFAANVALVGAHPEFAFYSPPTRLWELLVGAHLAAFAPNGIALGSRGTRDASAVVGLALIGASIASVNRHMPFPGVSALAPIFGTALLIGAGPVAWINRRLLALRPLAAIGLASYSLYLWHWPLLVVSDLNVSPAPAVKAAIVVIAGALAAATYVFVERPLRLGRASLAQVSLLVGAIAVLGIAGVTVHAAGGLPGRYPPVVQAIESFTFDYVRAYRHECTLSDGVDPATFRYCVDRPAEAGAPALFLWGDSHAEHLYPGVVSRYGKRWEIHQFTANGCPPILGHPTPAVFEACEPFNQRVLAEIARRRPERVIMAAAWKWTRLGLLRATLARVKAAGPERIDVIGPVPNWLPSLKRSLINDVRFASRSPTVASRMTFGLDPRIRPADRELGALVAEAGVNYISAWNLLCDDAGCLTRVGDGVTSLTAWDYGHLTSEGSTYLVSRFPE